MRYVRFFQKTSSNGPGPQQEIFPGMLPLSSFFSRLIYLKSLVGVVSVEYRFS